MVDLLRRHHDVGRRFEAAEFLEEGSRVAVRLKITDPHWEGAGETYKVVTFDASGGRAVLLQDCIDRDDALRHLAAA